MPMFICRWQNGDFSAVSARSRVDAIALLDEVGNAEECELFTVRNFVVHFKLRKEAEDLDEVVPVELEGFGEDTEDMLCKRVYPIYDKASTEATEDWPDEGTEIPQEKQEAAWKRVNDALITERNREWGMKKPVLSDDPQAAHLQELGNFPKSVVERAVREHRRRQIVEMPPKTDKIQ